MQDKGEYIWTDYRTDLYYDIGVRESSDWLEMSPYLEVQDREGNNVVVNYIPRFSQIFGKMLESALDKPEIRKDVRKIANIIMHLLVQVDRITGVSLESLREDILEIHIEKGYYGDDIKKGYEVLSAREKRFILHYLRLHIDAEGRRLYFAEAMRKFFPGCYIYLYRYDNIFFIHLPQKENEERIGKLNLLMAMFMDAASKVRVFWEYHFGILGLNKTMRIDNIEIV